MNKTLHVDETHSGRIRQIKSSLPLSAMTTKTTENNAIAYDVCRTARVARDARYDGLIFSGATSTRVYCRPTCAGKPPLASNNVYFQNAAQAEAAGYRPCLRCRPELSPGNLIRNGARWEVRHALGLIHQWTPSGESFDTLAAKIEAPERGIRAFFQKAVGTDPTGYLKTFQLGFAKMLITDTAFPLNDIAKATGFADASRMLGALTNLYHRDPLAVRKPIPPDQRHHDRQSCRLMLAYRPPFDWAALLDYFRKRAVRGVEHVNGSAYRRSFCLNGHTGWFSVQDEPDANAVRLDLHTSDPGCLMPVVRRVRRMLDLDADPLGLKSLFGKDRVLGPTWLRHPGLRVPVGWDAFEFAVRAIAGQLVTVTAATAVMGRIAALFSRNLEMPGAEGIERVFPGPAELQGADLLACGLTRTKAAAISALAQAVAGGGLELETTSSLVEFIRRCTAIRGIGDWTAQTIAMRGLGNPDAFPAGDLGIVKALSISGRRLKPKRIYEMAERWRPWRAYAAMLLWLMD
jgi:AraC family transcriptional regulator, regulatory protein of adaptative response / DNA-3-methyladenine glycosylase II